MIEIKKYDDRYIYLSYDKGENYNKLIDFLYDYFTYEVEANKLQKKKMYGYIEKKHLFNKKKRSVPNGMLLDLCKILKANKIEYKVSKELIDFNSKEWVDEQYKSFLDSDCSEDITPFPHQEKAIKEFLRRKKGFGELATSSGKSFIIYVIACLLAKLDNKVLIITDSINLVEQLKQDILSYTKNPQYWGKYVKGIYATSKDDKYDENAKVIISTYGSMRDEPEYFQDFNCVIVDEGHKATSNSITDIINKCWYAEYRIGMTGSLNGTREHELKTTALFGQIISIITARELIDKGMATPLKIEIVKLKRNRNPVFDSYPEYVDYLINDYPRMDYIVDEAIKLNKNVILLFNQRKFGKALYNTVLQRLKGEKRNVEYIDGEISVDERIRIKDSFETNDNVILVASYKTISTGVNAPNLRAIIFAQPIKSKISTVQSVGRVIRKSKGKDQAYVIDYWDTYGWGQYHSRQRKDIYKEEGHEWTEKTVEIEI